MKTLLIDNYDSFSHILFQYLWEINGQEPVFIHNDEWALEKISAEAFDSIVISPGPGRPDRARDFGICGEVIRAFPQIPLLGVCLGHQGLGLSVGARVVSAPVVRHGKSSRILHDGEGLFKGLPPGFTAVRYHSLVIEASDRPSGMVVTATAEDDGQIMAIRLRDRPSFGVQFHPESIGTEYGKILLRNFRDLAMNSSDASGHNRNSNLSQSGIGIAQVEKPSVQSNSPIGARLMKACELPWRDPEEVFQGLFQSCPASFWLDASAMPISNRHLVTYMGTGSKLIEAKDSEIRLWESDGKEFKIRTTLPGDPLKFLQDYMQDVNAQAFPITCHFTGSFSGGLVGYFGYEMKRFTGPANMATAQPSSLPDALFLEPDRILAFDHNSRKVYAFLPTKSGDPSPEAQTWLGNLLPTWGAFPNSNSSLDLIQSGPEVAESEALKLPWRLSADKDEYFTRIRNLQAAILSGEAYETCLTNEVKVEADVDPFQVYRLLRRTNPAPYAAYFNFPQGQILSASPERFLKLDKNGRLSSRPIKGTRRRGATPEEDALLKADLAVNAKDQSENLMIVDLVRNDFGKVCALGSVRVPESMLVEEHPTVFQLVSEVEGRLKPGQNALDALLACFPGGSMTGAPKLRAMELLASQEQRERGVFSGAMGYLGWNGTMDLGMVIRTLVCKEGVFSIGCGGAILAESNPEAEFAEAMLKAFAPMRAVELAVLGEGGGWRIGDLESMDRHD